MLLDFGDVKKSIKADAESLWDHKLVVPLHRPGLSLDGQTLTWSDDKGQTYKHKGPDISLYSVESAKFDKELLERHLESWLIEKWKCPQIQKCPEMSPNRLYFCSIYSTNRSLFEYL